MTTLSSIQQAALGLSIPAAGTAGNSQIDSGTAWTSEAKNWSYRNLIINGEMKVAQRGATFTSPADSTYTLDRWKWVVTGTGVVTVTQSTTVPNSTFANSLKVDVTTADTSIAASDRYWLMHVIEGLRCSRLGFGSAAAQSITVSFWVRLDSGTLTFPVQTSVGFTNSLGNRSRAEAFSITTNATWQKVTISLPGDTSGTWLQTNGGGLYVCFALTSGSGESGAGGSWGSTGTNGVTGNANFMENTANDLYLTGVQLEVGSVATPFEYRSYGEELFLCQRYYWRWTSTVAIEFIAAGFQESTTLSDYCIRYPQTMRAAPTGNKSAAGDFVKRNTANIDTTGINFGAPGLNSCEIEATTAADGTTGYAVLLCFDSTIGRWFDFSAEL